MPAPRPSTPDPAAVTAPGATVIARLLISADGLDPVLSPSPVAPAADRAGPEPTLPDKPVNRAARRGRGTDQPPAAARYRGSGGHARPAQGRRINPVRRSG